MDGHGPVCVAVGESIAAVSLAIRTARAAGLGILAHDLGDANRNLTGLHANAHMLCPIDNTTSTSEVL
jgi:hypothetical protein